MATNKHATIRYNALDKCFSNRGRKYFLDDLIEACNQAIQEFTGRAEGVKRRQIYDDIRFMKSDQGFSAPIESFREGKKTFHRYTDPDFSINKQEVSPKEQQQLQQALEILARFEGLPDFEWVEELKVRLNDQVPGIKKEQTNTHISFQSNPFLKGMEFFTPIYNAIRHERVIEVIYKSYKSEESKSFQLSPYHLKQYNNRWFLFGKSKDYDTLTNLALDRIISCEEINQPFESSEIDFQTYFEDVVGVTVPEDGKLEKIVLKVSKELYPYIESKPIHGSQKVINRENDVTTIELEVYSNYELKSILLGFGDGIQVLSPLQFREKVQKIIKSLNEKYL
ncbi:MAG: WYL domain-containing protein [Brumimicrobium sp.]